MHSVSKIEHSCVVIGCVKSWVISVSTSDCDSTHIQSKIVHVHNPETGTQCYHVGKPQPVWFQDEEHQRAAERRPASAGAHPRAAPPDNLPAQALPPAKVAVYHIILSCTPGCVVLTVQLLSTIKGLPFKESWLPRMISLWPTG